MAAGLTVAELVARLRADTGDFTRGLANAERSLGRFDARIGGLQTVLARTSQAVNNFFSGISIAAAGAVASLGAVGVSYNTLMQRTTAAFSVLLGNAENAKAMVGELTEFARSSPFPRQLFIAGAQQLIGFGLAAQRVVPAFQAIQDAVAAVGGTADDIGMFTNIFARIQSLGRANSEELMRFSMVGIDAFKLLAEQAGVSVAEMRDRVQKGALDSNTAIAMLTEGLAEKFGGAAAKVKETWVGAKDRIAGAWRDIGSHLMAPFIDPQGGGAAVKWANQIADLLRKLEVEVVKPLAARLDEFFSRVATWTDKIDFDGWLNKAVDLWNKYRDVLSQVLPILGLVSLSFAKQGLAMVPFLNQFANFLPIPGKLVMALAGLILVNDDLRESLLGIAREIGSNAEPVLRELGEALKQAVSQIGALLAAVAPGVISELGAAFILLLDAAVELVPVLTDIASVGLVAIANFAPPVISLIAQLAKWTAQLIDWLGPLGGVLLTVAAALIDLPGPLGLIHDGFQSLIPLVTKAWGVLAAHPLLGLAIALGYFAVQLSGGFEGFFETIQAVGRAFAMLPRIVGRSLEAVLNVVNSFGRAISQGLHDAMNPFQRHSPSLVDRVIAGVDLIAAKYGSLVTSVVPRLRTVEAAMKALNSAAAGAEFRFDSAANAEIAQHLMLLGGAGLLSAYQSLTTEIARLQREMEPLVERFTAEQLVLEEKQRTLDDLNRSYAEYRVEMRKTERAVEDAQNVVSDLSRDIEDAQSRIQEILNTPLKGSGAFSDAQFANDQAIAALQHRLNRLRMSDGPIDEMRELEAQIDRLRMTSEQLRLEEQLTLGPQQRELEKLADTVEEITFEEAAEQIAEAAAQVKELTKQLKPAEDHLDGLLDILERQQDVATTWERSIEDASSAVDRQSAVVEELGRTLGGLQSVLDQYSQRQQEIAGKAAQNWADVQAALRAAAAAGKELGADLPPIAHDLTGMGDAGAAAVGTLLDGIKSVGDEMGLFDTSQFEQKFKQMGERIERVIGVAMTGVMAYFGARGLGVAVEGASTILAGFGARGAASIGMIGTAMTTTVGAIAAAAGIIGGIMLGDWLVGRAGSDQAGKDFLDGLRPSDGSLQDTIRYLDEIEDKFASFDKKADEASNGWAAFTDSDSWGRLVQRLTPLEDTFDDARKSANLLGEEINSVKDKHGALNTAASAVFDNMIRGMDGFIASSDGAYSSWEEFSSLVAASGATWNFDDIYNLGNFLGIDFVEGGQAAIDALGAAQTAAQNMGLTWADVSDMSQGEFVALADASNTFRANLEANMSKAGSIFGVVAEGAQLTAADVKRHYEKMAADAEAWAVNMDILAAKGPGAGIPQKMLDELAAAGPKGAAQAAALVEAINNGSIDEIVGAMQRYEAAWGGTVADSIDAARVPGKMNMNGVVSALLGTGTGKINADGTLKPALEGWVTRGSIASRDHFAATGGGLGVKTVQGINYGLTANAGAASLGAVLNHLAAAKDWFEATGWNQGVELIQGIINALQDPHNLAVLKQVAQNLAANTTLTTRDGGHTGVPVTAVGGIFNGAQLRIIGEAGPEAVLPLNDFNRSMELLSQAGLLPRIAESLFGGFAGSAVTSGGFSMSTGTMAGGGGGGAAVVRGGDTIVNVTVQGSVVSERNLIEAVQRGLTTKGRSNGAVRFERVRG